MPANLDYFYLTTFQAFGNVPYVFNQASTKFFDAIGADVTYWNNDLWESYSIITLNIFH